MIALHVAGLSTAFTMAIVQHLPLDAGPIILCELDLGDPEGVATNQGLPAATSRTMSGVIPWTREMSHVRGVKFPLLDWPRIFDLKRLPHTPSVL